MLFKILMVFVISGYEKKKGDVSFFGLMCKDGHSRVVCSRLLVVCSHLLVVCRRWLLVCALLWSFEVVACFSNYATKEPI